jgi:autotransporter-associated beta strand protein
MADMLVDNSRINTRLATIAKTGNFYSCKKQFQSKNKNPMKIKPQNKVLSLLALATLTVCSAHAGVVGHWLLNEAPGSFIAADTSGNGMTATNIAHASVTFGVAGAPIGGSGGFTGTGMTLAGGNIAVGNDLQIPSFSSLNGAKKMTISVWFKANAAQATTYEGLFMTRTATDSLGSAKNYGIAIQQDGSNWRVDSRISGGNILTPFSLAALGQPIPWTHTALAWDGGTMTCYTNGVLCFSAPTGAGAGATITAGGQWTMGQDPTATDRHFAGSMSDLAVWNKALTPDQIYKIYTNGLTSGVDAVLSAQGVGAVWTNTIGGNWSVSGNWNGGSPNSVNLYALLAGSILAPSTVTNDSANSIGNVEINSAISYTLAGSSTLTLGGSTPAIIVDKGNHTVNTPLATSGTALTLDVSAGANLTNGIQSYADGTFLTGGGTLVLNSLANGGSPSGIGSSSSSAANLTIDGSTLMYLGSGASSDRSFQMGAGTASLDASGSGAMNWTDGSGSIGYIVASLVSTLELKGTNTGNNTMALALANGNSFNTALTKNGAGTWVFGNAANSFSGNTAVNAGKLSLSSASALAASPVVTVASGAILDVSAVAGYTLPSGQTLQGVGSVKGDFTAGTGKIGPATIGVVGTLVFSNSLSLQGGTTINLDLPALTNSPTDIIDVKGDLNLSGITTLLPNLLASPKLQTGSYIIMRYSGSLTGDTNNLTITQTTIDKTDVVIDATAKTISIAVTAQPIPNYTWVGDGILNQWSLTSAFLDWTTDGGLTTTNWLNGPNVFIDDTGSVFPIMNTVGTVAPGSITVNTTSGLTIAGAISGGTALAKNGSGQLIVSGASTYTGGNVLNAGRIQMGNNSSLGRPPIAGTNWLVIANGTTLDVYGYSVRDLALGDAPVIVQGTGTDGLGAIVNTRAGGSLYPLASATLLGDTTVNAGLGQIGFRSWLVPNLIKMNLNGFTLTKTGTNVMAYFDVLCTNGGTINITAGTLNMIGAGATSGGIHITNNLGLGIFNISNGAAMILGDNAAPSGVESTWTLNLAGQLQRQSDLIVKGWQGPVNLLPGYSFNFGGIIRFRGPIGGSQNLVVSNSASNIRLEGTNTYTGNTLVTAGTLTIATNGSIATSPIIELAGGALNVATITSNFKLLTGQTLRGRGITTGNVTINSGATLTPGVSSIGTNTFAGNLTNSGTIVMDVNSTGASDRVTTTGGTNTYGGTLQINNVGPTLASGNTFALFSANGIGSFASISPANPNSDPALLWSFNRTNGVLSVLAVIATNPTNITVVVSPGQMTLSWPFDHTGWTLQVQTNSLNVGLGTNWFSVAGSTTTNQVVVPLNPASPAVFYRMVLP